MVQISTTVHIKVDSIYPGMLLCKNNFFFSKLLDFNKLLTKKGRHLQDVKNVKLEKLPHQKHISANKKKHLKPMGPFLHKQELKDFYLK